MVRTGAERSIERLRGTSATMVALRALVTKVARVLAPVVINGESGTGKELVARSLHEMGPRAGKPFIAVNCGAIPEQLLESEFFGYRKGAFTGASEDRIGFFQAADGGTLFLDEIGDLPLAMQSKLLRTLQERTVRQIGSPVEVPVDVRIVAATHKKLAVEVARGRFRQDLYYRLNVIEILVAPLRERVEDLPELCEHILAQFHATHPCDAAGLDTAPERHLSLAAMDRLACYGFPGNVRELENILHRAVVLSTNVEIGSDELGLDTVKSVGDRSLDDAIDLRASQAQARELLVMAARAQSSHTIHPDRAGEVCAPGEWQLRLRPIESDSDLPADLERHLDTIERRLLTRALDEHHWNRTLAGARLGLSLRQIRHRMGRLSLRSAGGARPEFGEQEVVHTDFGVIDWMPG